jgi:2-polyprenyl-6-methoxyphenol hydroxylase-like FAD-dependent oxidoreductase
MDVLWFKLSRQANDKAETFGRMESGQILVLINRGDHWQCGYVISKGSAEKLKAQGISPIREAIAKLAPFLESRVYELKSIDDLKLLSVVVDRLPIWHRSGLLCIGDAAHAMSPVGGVGINLAIQDAIATANLLADRLSKNQSLSDEMLASVQARRAWPTKMTQALQLFVQNRVISKVLAAHARLEPPKLLRLFNQFPYLRRFPGYLIGLGIRPERIRSPERPRPL